MWLIFFSISYGLDKKRKNNRDNLFYKPIKLVKVQFIGGFKMRQSKKVSLLKLTRSSCLCFFLTLGFLIVPTQGFAADAMLAITPTSPINVDGLKIEATDTYNSYQFKIQGHAGGDRHVQMVTGDSNSRITLMAGVANDFAPRFHCVGAQDGETGIRGWAVFDYGSKLYDLPSAKLVMRHYDKSGVQSMLEIRGRDDVYLAHGMFKTYGGAYCDGYNWVNASSRDYKEDIKSLESEAAKKALYKMEPVSYRYKGDKNKELRLGFIAEDVPELVSSAGRKGMNTMDVVAVLTRVVKDQEKENNNLRLSLSSMVEKLERLESRINAIEKPYSKIEQ